MADAAGRDRQGRKPEGSRLSRVAGGDQRHLRDAAGREPGWLSYDLPRAIGKEAWKGKWRGQAQKWFAFRFEGDESEIDIATPAGGHKAEFDAWRWERLSATPELIIPFKQAVYRQVAEIFAPYSRPA